jgi:hypothetical protein
MTKDARCNNATRRIELIRRIDAEPILNDPNNLESQIARNRNVMDQANARYADYLRDKYGDLSLPRRDLLKPPPEFTGPSERVLGRDNAENRRGADGENETADLLWLNGHNVERKPIESREQGVKKPDFLIDGEIFDAYTPLSSRVRNIWDQVEKKCPAGRRKMSL